jgi:hypothetical protein
MKYTIENRNDGMDIEVAESKENQDKLLEAFQECQEGRCTCPTGEYSKLEALEIEEDGYRIRLRLKAKPGEHFDQSEISKCLEYTDNKLGNDK